MSAYVIADMEPTDEARFMEYGRKAAEVTQRYGGRVLAVGGAPQVLEGTWKPHFVIVIEFPSMPDLRRWYDSPEYRTLIPLRTSASKYSNLVSVEGVGPNQGSRRPSSE